MMKPKHLLWAFALSLCSLFVACDEEETALGLGLQDPNTLYSGIRDTIAVNAYLFCDDSMVTSLYNMPVIGSYRDNTSGSVVATFFTQIAMNDDNGVIFDSHCLIDSVLLTFAVSEIFPAQTSRNESSLHVKVDKLKDPIFKDSIYYQCDEIPITRVNYYDGQCRIKGNDSVSFIEMKLNDEALALFRNQSYENNEAFLQATKGIRVSMTDDERPTMLALNLAASNTKLTVHYRYIRSGEDTISETKDFVVGYEAGHFNHIERTFSGQLASFNTNTKDSLDGTHLLPFIPLGGTYVKLDFDDFVRTFHQQHPYAIIHNAEVVMPVETTSSSMPTQIIGRLSRSEGDYLPDLIDALTHQAYDGSFHYDTKCYRLQVTQHLQRAISQGHHDGTYLYINSRRYSPKWVTVNGSDPAKTNNNPIRIEFVYSEPEI